jgi:homoserine kinase
LPAVVPHADAAFTAARSALLVAVLSATVTSPDALFAATEDRLHQPYRAAAAPQTAALVAELRAIGSAAVVSGAGPTVLVLARDEVEVQRVRTLAPADWRCEQRPVDPLGAHVVAVPRIGAEAQL